MLQPRVSMGREQEVRTLRQGQHRADAVLRAFLPNSALARPQEGDLRPPWVQWPHGDSEVLLVQEGTVLLFPPPRGTLAASPG
jgi:hypothetical protein